MTNTRDKQVFKRFNMPCLNCTDEQVARCDDPSTAIKTKFRGKLVTGCPEFVEYLRRPIKNSGRLT